VTRDLLVTKETKVLPDQLVIKAKQEKQALLAFRVIKEFRDLMVTKETKVLLDQSVTKVLRVLKVHPVTKV
jgi:NADPH-dependent 7-cyano-7-deazaguanine reductase QueF